MNLGPTGQLPPSFFLRVGKGKFLLPKTVTVFFITTSDSSQDSCPFFFRDPLYPSSIPRVL